MWRFVNCGWVDRILFVAIVVGIRSVEIETAANGWEIECRFKQPKGDGPYIESTKHVFTDATEASTFLASKLSEMI